MEKRFKNNIFYVTGSKHLLNAVSEELTEGGYKKAGNYNPTDSIVGIYPQEGSFQWLSDIFKDVINYTLPSDWDKVIKLATEKKVPRYKAGQFLKYDSLEKVLCYISKIEGERITLQQEIGVDGEPIEVVDSQYTESDLENYYSPISDEEALQWLKAAHARRGIVEGATMVTPDGNYFYISRLALTKTVNLFTHSAIKQGKSQLAHFNDYAWYTADSNVKVAPKEVRVAGYNVEVFMAGSFKTAKIGCQHYTKDSLITIRDMIIHGIDRGRTFLQFRHSTAGDIKVTVDELNAAIKLLDNEGAKTA